ncbi:hypothetical protein [Alistipes finegoldii]|uniref:hypothetical protein n=1 Tax=Alistipes finegoldii TaxID=214856 RepID=UPI003AEF653A
MKTRVKIGICLLLAAGFAACDKDETPVVGQLKVEYINMEANFVSIYTEAGNEIYSKQNPKSNFTVDLNPGNYAILSGSSGSSGSGKEYFQIQAGRTTRASYHNSGTPIINYE